MLAGTLPAADLAAAIAAATRRYAKRQETWFRHQLRRQPSAVSHPPDPVWMLDASREPSELAAGIRQRWSEVKAEGGLRMAVGS